MTTSRSAASIVLYHLGYGARVRGEVFMSIQYMRQLKLHAVLLQ